ncbi:MAG: hypothetical protein LBU74_00040 [Methanobacteriaceae archaeon]|jgi:hypothetical protein|nr:hypothetical protein [Candidatus Methanorudis spinitermitis]
MNDEEKTKDKLFSNQPTTIKTITIIGISCILGIILIFTIGSILFDDSTELNLYENKHISFKYPKSFIKIPFFLIIMTLLIMMNIYLNYYFPV